MSNKQTVNEIVEFINGKNTKWNFDKMLEIVRNSQNPNVAAEELVREFNISKECAIFTISIPMRELCTSKKMEPEYIYKLIYNSKRGHDAFIKLCKSNKLSRLNNIEFVKKNEDKLKTDPECLYKLVLKTYPKRGYVTNMKLVKQIYFEAFKLV